MIVDMVLGQTLELSVANRHRNAINMMYQGAQTPRDIANSKLLRGTIQSEDIIQSLKSIHTLWHTHHTNYGM